jgi:type I site-specific restriction endonuclease
MTNFICPQATEERRAEVRDEIRSLKTMIQEVSQTRHLLSKWRIYSTDVAESSEELLEWKSSGSGLENRD